MVRDNLNHNQNDYNSPRKKVLSDNQMGHIDRKVMIRTTSKTSLTSSAVNFIIIKMIKFIQ